MPPAGAAALIADAIRANVDSFPAGLNKPGVRIVVDGAPVFDRQESAEPFDLVIPIQRAEGPRKIELFRTRTDQVAEADNRPVSVQLSSIGEISPPLWAQAAGRRKSGIKPGGGFWMVLPRRIELRTSPLPRECSTTELRQRLGGALKTPSRAARTMP